jgi:transposase
VHAPSEGKSDNSEYCFYKELGQVFDHFPKYHIEIMLEILIQNLGDRIFSNRQLGRRLHQDNSNNGITAVNFATSKTLVVKSTKFPHRNFE